MSGLSEAEKEGVGITNRRDDFRLERELRDFLLKETCADYCFALKHLLSQTQLLIRSGFFNGLLCIGRVNCPRFTHRRSFDPPQPSSMC
jgi:hypothetical protein